MISLLVELYTGFANLGFVIFFRAIWGKNVIQVSVSHTEEASSQFHKGLLKCFEIRVYYNCSKDSTTFLLKL